MQVTLQTDSEGARTLVSKPLTHFQSKIYLNTHPNPKLHYPLPISSLSEKQYIQINKAHILQAISSMGFNRTWILALRFRFHTYGTLQLKHIEVEALIWKLHSLHDMLHKPNTSKNLMILFKWYQHA